MTKRNKEMEEEIEYQLKNNIGKIAAFKYETCSGKDKILESKLIVGKIIDFKEDFNNREYGDSVYIGKAEYSTESLEQLRVLSTMLNKEINFIGEGKSEKDQVSYRIRKISNFHILDE